MIARCAMAAALVLTSGSALAQQIEQVTLPSSSPLVSFRIVFLTGAASDPAGKEGVAALTAAMLSQGGSREMTYDQIVRAMFPMATAVQSQVDKEMTVFFGETHIDNLDKYYSLFRAMLLDPGWREEDFRRLKSDAINYLRVELRGNNDEELGKEALYTRIYEGHPYGHENAGTAEALEKLTLDDLKTFYRQNYTRANLVLGLGGGYPKGFDEKVAADFSRLSSGSQHRLDLPEPKAARRLRVRLIEKNTRATAISLGFPLAVNRSSPDWPALFVMQSYFGQHRSQKSRLFQRMRELRGLNYGDYAYIEYFPRGMYRQFDPDPNLARHQQIFQIWVRPVEPQNAMFALREALYELDRLVAGGMSQAAFESTRQFLSKFVNTMTETESAELAYLIDSKFYGIPEFNGYVKGALARLTLAEVNAAIKKYLRAADLDIVVVTPEAEGMKKAILSGEPSTITYVSPKPKEILEEDQIISGYKLNVSSVDVVPVDSVFEK